VRTSIPTWWLENSFKRECPTEQANASAWKLGFNALQRAFNNNEDFSFETTLSGNTIARELHQGIKAGLKIYIWDVGLASPELHVARVRTELVVNPPRASYWVILMFQDREHATLAKNSGEKPWRP
jgi:hypothetical protein